MTPEIIALYETASRAHIAAHVAMQRLTNELNSIASRAEGMEEMADIALAMKQIAEKADDTRKEAERIKKAAIERACVLWIQKGKHEPIRTEYVSATPDYKIMPKLPDRRRNPKEYAALMDFCGIDRKLWDVGDNNHAYMNVHWPGMLEHLSMLIATAQPLPPGIDPTKTYTIYQMILRARKEISGAVLSDSNISTKEPTNVQ